MSLISQMQLAYEMWKDWLKSTFGSGVNFATAPGYVQGYTK